MSIKRITVKLDESTYKLLRLASALRGMNMSDIGEKAITEYMENDDEVMVVQRHWEGERENHDDE